jgi:glycosyltransferase involved in cell wall biosynthesis
MSATTEGRVKPLVAIVANVQTPYRLHLHRRIVREMPEIRLASLFTHGNPDQPWANEAAPEINPVEFGRGEDVSKQGRSGHLREWLKGGRILRWLEENNVAAVVLGGYSDLARLRLIAACRERNIPCLVFGDSNAHRDRATGLKRIIKSSFLRWVVRSSTAVMPYGTLGAQYFARYGARPERIFFHPAEPDYDLVRRVQPSIVQDVRARYGLAVGRRRMVISARLIGWKRVDLAILAFAAIAAVRPEWDLVIVGDGPVRADLQRLVPRELESRVIWTGFIGDQARVSAIYQLSDLLLCPSDYEPWGVVLTEAAAAGMAIIASDTVGAAPDLVRDGFNGGVFHTGNLQSFIEILARVTDAAQIERLKAGSSVVLEDWRQRGDPVDGLRRALAFAGVIHPSRATTPA